MSCWVVPTIAAEFWRVSVEHVMDCIRRGAVSVRREHGFTFVDILPDPNASKPKLPREQRPPTYETAEAKVEVTVAAVAEPELDQDEAEELEGAGVSQLGGELISRNRTRMRTAALRRRPVAAAR